MGRPRDKRLRKRATERAYERASRLAAAGQVFEARRIYAQIRRRALSARIEALVLNDLAAFAASDGDTERARQGFQSALASDPNCELARVNLALVVEDDAVERAAASGERTKREESERVLVESRETEKGPEPRDESREEEERRGARDERREPDESRETRDESREPHENRELRVQSPPPGATESSVGSAQVRVSDAQRPTLNAQRSLPQCSDAQRPTLNAQRSLPKCLLMMITYNRLAYTRLALEAVLKLDYPALDLVVWDNNSNDGTVEYLKARVGSLTQVRLVLSPTNRGVVYPMNAVWWSDHQADLVAKVDNDTLVPPDLIRRLAECHMQCKAFGVLSGFHFRKEGEAIADEAKIVTRDGVRVFRQPFVGGCAVMVRREVLEALGPIPWRERPSPPLAPPCKGGDRSPQARRGAEEPSPQPGFARNVVAHEWSPHPGHPQGALHKKQERTATYAPLPNPPHQGEGIRTSWAKPHQGEGVKGSFCAKLLQGGRETSSDERQGGRESSSDDPQGTRENDFLGKAPWPAPSETQESGRPFLDGGWTYYQELLAQAGYINGYPWPPIHVDHMEDTRSPHCIRTQEHESYKQQMRGMSLDEFTEALCVWRPE